MTGAEQATECSKAYDRQYDVTVDSAPACAETIKHNI